MDVGEFRASLHVLAVDDDRASLMLIEKQLQFCRYNVTTVTQAETALEILRARRDSGDQFDLVITDLHMPVMDGFRLLELISLEMDIPVIIVSANEALETMMKGIKHGARNYLVKPVSLDQLKNLWIHVVKKNTDNPSNSINNHIDDGHHQSQSGDSEDENVANHTQKSSRKKKEGTSENKEAKRQRMQWSGQLHRLFVEVVHRLGIDKAVPKKIVEMMNVPGLTREHVASHMQKYRLYLKKVSTGTYKSRNPFSDEAVWSQGNRHQPSIAGSSNSSNPFARMSFSAAFGTHSMLPSQSVQLMNQGNLGISSKDMGSVGYGGNQSQIDVPGSQNGLSNFTSAGNSNPNIYFPSGPSGSSFANISNSMAFNTSKAFPSGTSSNSSANIQNGSPPLPASMEATYYPYRSYASLLMSGPDPSDENRRKINRLSRLAASSGQNSEFQNQMAELTRTTTPVAGFIEQVAPFNIGGNTNSTVMPNYNSAPGGASSVISGLPNIQMYSDVMQSQMLNGGDGSGSLLDHQAAADQLNYNDESLIGTSSGQNGLSDDLDEFFSDCINQDAFKNSDGFMDGDYEFAP